MKIIKHGVIPETQPIRAECNHCHTIFEFLLIEAQYSSDQRDGPFYGIGCPVCAKTVYKDAPRINLPYA